MESARSPKPRRTRPAGGQPQLADRSALLGVLLFIISRGDAVRVVLHGLLLHPRRRARAVAAAAVPLPGQRRGHEHVHPRVLELHVHWALQSIKRGNRVGLQVGLALTFLMGLVFLVTQINEYFKAGFSIHDGAFASVFYGLTGLHGAHVFVGLTLLAIMNIRTFRGHFSPEPHIGVEIGRHLLALRGHHVDHRVPDRLHPVGTDAESPAIRGRRLPLPDRGGRAARRRSCSRRSCSDRVSASASPAASRSVCVWFVRRADRAAARRPCRAGGAPRTRTASSWSPTRPLPAARCGTRSAQQSEGDRDRAASRHPRR